MILDQIVKEKIKEIQRAQEKVSLKELIEKSSSFATHLRGFKEAISRPGKINLIAEIKKTSPSGGVLREEFEPAEIARTYKASGASALSVLTEKNFFQGNIDYLKKVKAAVDLPVLRKDFVIDKYQIYESVCAGADAILLIVKLLSEEKLAEFSRLCAQLKIDAVYEVHSEEDLDKALSQDSDIIGINNRDLNTFEIDLQVSSRLIKRIPGSKVIISESGIKTPQDVRYLQNLGVHAVLIGEIFMRSKDIASKVKEIMGG